jgi:hypothetical protein
MSAARQFWALLGQGVVGADGSRDAEMTMNDTTNAMQASLKLPTDDRTLSGATALERFLTAFSRRLRLLPEAVAPMGYQDETGFNLGIRTPGLDRANFFANAPRGEKF